MHQVSLEYGLYGQWMASPLLKMTHLGTTPADQPGDGFGMGKPGWANDYYYDAMFRLEGTTGGVQEPDIYVDPDLPGRDAVRR